MKKKILQYNIILRPEPEGGFTVVVPALPGCITYGKNLKEAKEMAYDAIGAYLASVKKHGGHILSDKDNLFATLEIIYA
ncbi:MAG TPA: type II toxin-antitoxin system HicB family antitoxin [Candidatus Pacearchaeota archaeon]|nr:type II toxin-antitoxin system HicB family antitoxin [Candidatus Pacearchaeota archaeon]HPR79637.1 type II toxin-antitoxin system HicB family antitoxin [Candidatus Pacearchaeota archaeon]